MLYTIRSIGTRQSRRHRALWSVIFSPSSTFSSVISACGFLSSVFGSPSIQTSILSDNTSQLPISATSHAPFIENQFCDICIRQSPRRYGEMVGPWGMHGALTAWRKIRVVFCALRGHLCDGHAPRSFSSPCSSTRATRPPIPSRVRKVITGPGLVIWDLVLRCTRRLRRVNQSPRQPLPHRRPFPNPFPPSLHGFWRFRPFPALSLRRTLVHGCPGTRLASFSYFVFFCCFLGLATGGLSALAPGGSTRL